jgi:hypothetical protein
LVPIGSFHTSMSLVSICAPSGKLIQRSLPAASDQSGKAGENTCTLGASVRVLVALYRPVCESSAGATSSASTIGASLVSTAVILGAAAPAAEGGSAG